MDSLDVVQASAAPNGQDVGGNTRDQLDAKRVV